MRLACDFISNLAEIDRDLHKFDHVTSNTPSLHKQGSPNQPVYPMVNQVSDMAIQNSKAAHPSISPGIYNLKPNSKPLPKQGTWIRFQRPVCLENFDTNGSLAIQGKRTKKAIDSLPELPNKKFKVSMVEVSSSIKLVEAIKQPCQEQ